LIAYDNAFRSRGYECVPSKVSYAAGSKGVRRQPRYFNINGFASGSGFGPSLRPFGFDRD
jgi:hypothetical protein